MAGRLKGKVALVTAAAQGFGRAIAEAFINQSATLIATDVDAKSSKGSRPRKPRSSTFVRQPRARLGTTQEVAALALLLASEQPRSPARRISLTAARRFDAATGPRSGLISSFD